MKPPKHLSRKARGLWQQIIDDYPIDDAAGLAILETSLEALDKAQDCRKIIDKEGLQITDRFGQVKAHPLCSVERDARAQFLQGLKQLNFDLEPLRDGPGRPGGK